VLTLSNAAGSDTGRRSPCVSESSTSYDSGPATPPNALESPNTRNKPCNSPGPGDHSSECDTVMCQSESMHCPLDHHVPDSQVSDRQVSPMSAGRPAGEKEAERDDSCMRGGADSLPQQQEPSPSPVLVERNGVAAPEWPVDGVINSRTVISKSGKVRLEYLVDWRGYTPSWQPRRDLIPGCEELVDEFHKRYPNRPSPENLGGRGTLKRRGRPPLDNKRKRMRLGP
jgi:hypothetical protein